MRNQTTHTYKHARTHKFHPSFKQARGRRSYKHAFGRGRYNKNIIRRPVVSPIPTLASTRKLPVRTIFFTITSDRIYRNISDIWSSTVSPTLIRRYFNRYSTLISSSLPSFLLFPFSLCGARLDFNSL